MHQLDERIPSIIRRAWPREASDQGVERVCARRCKIDPEKRQGRDACLEVCPEEAILPVIEALKEARVGADD